ncbi:MAG: hypothetical protein KC464_29545, partial [Myxococcales bacterium]|nr:hypothetical protein [Myxococcales bacterium]
MKRVTRIVLALATASVATTTTACVDDGAGEADDLDVADVSQASTFDWGSDCSSGSGSFTDAIPYRSTKSVGLIPVGKRDVSIELDSAVDVDVQLVDRATGTQIIAWPSGLLHGATAACTTYRDVEYCYSGYDGVGGAKGHETIAIHGDTNTELEMRAYGYVAGDAEVRYAWLPVTTCNETGDGAFSAYLDRAQVATIGDIPAGKVGVEVRMAAAEDLDIQLFDGDVALVRWPDGRLSGAGTQTLAYRDMTITWSGYNGDGTGLGHEYLRIDGAVTTTLTMKAYAYQAGTAQVSYRWGAGAGAVCGGHVNPPHPACADGLTCKDLRPMGLASDATGECHTETWCLDAAMAEYNCAGLPHVAVPGQWGCEELTCTWIADTSMTCSLADQTCPAGYACAIGCPTGENCGINPPGVCEPTLTCSLADQTCPAGYTCAIGCPTGENCGINPPGVCEPTLTCSLANQTCPAGYTCA